MHALSMSLAGSFDECAHAQPAYLSELARLSVKYHMPETTWQGGAAYDDSIEAEFIVK